MDIQKTQTKLDKKKRRLPTLQKVAYALTTNPRTHIMLPTSERA